jgi:hypothetical protein
MVVTINRSPRAPRYSLAEAVTYVSRIYNGVHRSAIDATTAYQLMGFAGKSGTSATALGSIRQFGLIDGIGDRTRVSDLALRILEPASPDELHAALREALLQPSVFKAIMERFEGRVPAANEPIRAFLIRDMGFSKQGAEDCISALRTSMKQVGDLPNDVALNVDQPAVSDSIENDGSSTEQRREKLPNASELIRLPLTKDCTVELRFEGSVTTQAIDNLIKHIDLMKAVWATE